MAPKASKELVKVAEESGSDFSDDVFDSDAEQPTEEWRMHLDEKDSDEEELERLVLGDAATFREQLFKSDGLDDGVGSDLEGLGLGDNDADGSDLEGLDDAELFQLDTGLQKASDSQSTALVVHKGGASQQKSTETAPAWEDSDDERLTISLASATQLRKLRTTEADDMVDGVEYTRRLRQQYLRLNPLPDWVSQAEERPTKRRRRSSAASGDSSSDSDMEAGDDEDEVSALPLDKFLRDASALRGDKSSKIKKLRPEVIDIQRSRDIPDSHKDAVTSLAFHPKHPVLMSSSTSSILHLHHIAPTAHPTPNPLLTSAQAKQVPVLRAEFLHPSGDRIFFAGRRRFIHSWQLSTGLIQKTTKLQGHQAEQKSWERFRLSPCGRWMGLVASTRKGGGVVNVLNVNTMQWIAAARLDSRGGIADFCWWRNGNGLTILGKGGQIGEWSMASKRFLGIWHDEGNVGATVLALGGRDGPATLGGDRWTAVGSNSGVMNVYDRRNLVAPSKNDDLKIKERPEPNRSFMQLTTPVTILTFSPDGQILAFGSLQKKDALRLAHLPTCTVYKNWPTEQTPLGRITALAFGSNSDTLAVGNDVGKVRLWEIRS